MRFKYLLTGAILIFGFQGAQAQRNYTITRAGGGPDGWNEIEQVIDDTSVVVHCIGKGYDKGKIGPDTGGDTIKTRLGNYNVSEYLLPKVDKHVLNGNLEGSIDIDHEYVMEWKAKDAYTMTITIKKVRGLR